MKVTFIGHAAILIEAHGLRILSDPWWGNPCFGAQWWNYPLAKAELAEGQKLDYIYISHGHHDHLHPGTLTRLDHDAKVLIAANTDMGDGLRKAGFEVIELGPDTEYELGGPVRCRIMPTYADDSLMVVSDGRESCANLNDALHAAPPEVQERFIARLKTLYPQLDYVFCGYGVASHFPNCYRVPGKDREATAAARQRHFNAQWASLIARLQPKFGLPFAADVVFLEEDLFWANEPTHNSERPTEALARQQPGFRGQTFDIAPGFQILDGRIVAPVKRQKMRAEDLRRDLADQITRARRFGRADADTVTSIHRSLDANLVNCREYLAGFPGDYRILIRFPEAAQAILVEKRAREIATRVVDEAAERASCDLLFTTRAQYLRTSLTRKYGNETLFVGSGCLFDYPSRAQAVRNLQRELSVMVREQEHPLPARPAAASAPVAALKRIVKRLIGRKDPPDLYDLGIWTTWRAD
jgi:hypothetical protein